MADEILKSNGNLRMRLYLPNAFANPWWVTTTEANAGQEVEAVFDLANYNPLVQASDDEEWNPLNAKDGVEARGAANYGGNVTFKHPGNTSDASNLAALVWQFVKDVWTDMYVLWSVDGETGDPNQPDILNFAEGDFYSLIRVITDEWSDTITGEEDFDYTRNLLKNGFIDTYSIISDTVPSLTASAVGSSTIVGSTGGLVILDAEVNGRDYWSAVNWSSDTAGVSVSRYGIVTVPAGTTAGTVTITASLPNTSPLITDTVTITVS